MKGFLRRLRGIVGTGLTWAFGWTVINTGLILLSGLPLRFVGAVALSNLFQGFLAGGTFAVILSIAERRRSLEDLSLKRTALWGGIGGILLRLAAIPLILPVGIPLPNIFIPLVIDGLTGAGLASGSVALARRADGNLIESDGRRPALEGD
jgi:hypothetical protein